MRSRNYGKSRKIDEISEKRKILKSNAAEMLAKAMYHLMRKIQDMFLTSIKIFWWRPFSKFQLKPLQESLDLSSDEEISSDSEISELSSDTSDVSSTDSDTSDAFIGGKKEKIKRRVKKSRDGKNGTIEDYSSDESSGTSVYDEISVYSSSQVFH